MIVLHETGIHKSPFSPGQGRYGGKGDRKKKTEKRKQKKESIQGFRNKANYKLF